MKLPEAGAFLIPAFVLGAIACSQEARTQQPEQAQQTQQTQQTQTQQAKSGMGRWQGGHMGQMGPMWNGPGPMPRHHVAMMWGIPEPYASMSNPLPRTEATLTRGASVYAENCQACHGSKGYGDGEAGRGLSPPPGNLAWLSDMPVGRWDPFIYWTVAEGGAEFGTAMPAFKDTLSKDEIWAVSTYIQAHLPKPKK